MPNRNCYISNSNSASVSVIDGTTDALDATIAVGSRPGPLAMTPDGSQVYVARTRSGSPQSFAVINTAANTAVTVSTAGLGLTPVGVAVTPDGTKAVFNCLGPNNANPNTGTWALVVSTATNTITQSLNVSPSLSNNTPTDSQINVVISPNSATAYLCWTNNGLASFAAYDIAANTFSVVLGGRAVGFCLTNDGSTLYCPLNNRELLVVDTATLTVLTLITGLANSAQFYAVLSPDNTTLYLADVTRIYVISAARASSAILNTLTPTTTAFPLPAITLTGSFVYFGDSGSSGNVTILNTASITLSTLAIAPGFQLENSCTSSTGDKIYTAVSGNAEVGIIATATNTLITTVGVQGDPIYLTASAPVVAPPALTIPKLFIPRTGLSSYDESDFDIDWRALERWGNSWAPTLFFPNKPGRTIRELTENWVQLEVWAQGKAFQAMVAGGIGSAFRPLLVPRKDSLEPEDLTVNWNTVQLWANSL